MSSNPYFWLALILYFFGSAAGRLFYVLRKKRSPSLLILAYLILAALSSLGLWFNYQPLGISEIISLVMLFFPVSGFLSGYIIFLHPLVLAVPFALSMALHIPLSPLVEVNSYRVGTLLFYPSNEDSLRLGWTSEGGDEELVALQGDSAGVLFIRKELPEQLFFLKEELAPVALLSRSVPVSELSNADPSWFYPLDETEQEVSGLYTVSYPAVYFHTPGFFNRQEYSIDQDRIVIERR
ncbi:MAG: hypothetical protein PQJ50_12975 [Spirochaetales bacterium]|nr:hypothetical protein [Spirochaetales bacterium]